MNSLFEQGENGTSLPFNYRVFKLLESFATYKSLVNRLY
jgi:hypothetical protein